MNAETHLGTSLPDTLVGQHLLARLGGAQFLVHVLSCDAVAMRISFPGTDNPLEDTWLRLEYHDDEGVTSFRARVLEGARERGAGLLLEYPTQFKRRLHRDAFRVPTDLMAQVRDVSELRRYNADVVNLSSAGALLQMDAPIAAEAQVALSLAIPRHPKCQIMSEVVYARHHRDTPLSIKGRFGIRFVDADPHIKNTLSHYVGERLRHLACVD